MVTTNLTNVKSMLVLLLLKMNGEMNIVQIMVMLHVTVHSMFQLVMVLGIVKILMLSLLKLST
jgi:hypothetical protein